MAPIQIFRGCRTHGKGIHKFLGPYPRHVEHCGYGEVLFVIRNTIAYYGTLPFIVIRNYIAYPSEGIRTNFQRYRRCYRSIQAGSVILLNRSLIGRRNEVTFLGSVFYKVIVEIQGRNLFVSVQGTGWRVFGIQCAHGCYCGISNRSYGVGCIIGRAAYHCEGITFPEAARQKGIGSA